jgi:DDE superfamily endonuclease
MVATLKRRQSEPDKESLRAVAKSLAVDPAQLRRWKAKVDQMTVGITKKSNFKVNVTATTLNKGRNSSIKEMEVLLLKFMLEKREQGMSVSIRMVVVEASKHSPDFRNKSASAKSMVVRRWVSSHAFSHRVHTHESQRNAHHSRAEALEWMTTVRSLLVGHRRSDDFILNMDQTPIFFSMQSNKTLHSVGAKTVNVRSSTSSTMRATAAVTITAAGGYLPTMMIFKGVPGGRIEREFAKYNPGGKYAVQQKAWMDSKVMISWVQQVLKPYVETAPFGVRPILFLDSYRCHMMTDVVSSIQDLGVQVEHIPGGCTCHVQPVDIGINKPLKNRVKNQWEDWMIEQGGETIKFTPPSRQMVAGWVVTSIQELGTTLIQNSWRHDPFSYRLNSDINA